MKTPREFLEDKGIDCNDIVAYPIPRGTKPPIDMNVEKLLGEYAVQALAGAVESIQDWLSPTGKLDFTKRMDHILKEGPKRPLGPFNYRELTHLAVNFAITCEKGYDKSFEHWLENISPEWRKIANR